MAHPRHFLRRQAIGVVAVVTVLAFVATPAVGAPSAATSSSAASAQTDVPPPPFDPTSASTPGSADPAPSDVTEPVAPAVPDPAPAPADPSVPDPSVPDPSTPDPSTPDPSAPDPLAPPAAAPEPQPPVDVPSEPGAGAALDPQLLVVTGAIASVVTDGTPEFDVDNAPGDDSGPNNGIVRTNDTVQYRFDFSTDSASTNPLLTSTLPAGMEWQAAPPQCSGPGTVPHPTGVYDSVTGQPGGDSRLLVCQLPSTATSVSNSLTPIARVTTASLDGETKSVSFTADDDQTPTPIASNSVSTVVSAAAFYNLEKVSINQTPLTGPGAAGTQPGVLTNYMFGIKIDHPDREGDQQLKGITPLASPITFTDDLSAYSPNAVLADWGTGGTGCLPTIPFGNALPYSSYAQPGANPSNSVADTGVITCAGGAPGGQFTVTLTGTDTTTTQFPVTGAGGRPLPASDRFYVATGMLSVWQPVQDVVDAGGQISNTNTLTDFDPVDLTGASNYGTGTEPTADNTVVSVVTGEGNWQKLYRGYDSENPDGGTAAGAGDIRASVGARYRSQEQFAAGVLGAQNLIMCDVFDHTGQMLAPLSGSSAPASSIGPITQPFVIEYGVPAAYPATFADMRSATCDDGDATWSTSPTDPALGGALTANGFRDSIDRVRMRLLAPVGPIEAPAFQVALEVTGPSSLDPANNPGGDLITNFGHMRVGAVPTWLPDNYDPLTNANIGQGDRLQLVLGQVRVSKSVVEQTPGSGGQVAPGSDARFRLQPSVTTNGAVGAPLQDVIITDVMPSTAPRLTVNPLSATVPPGATVEFCSLCDGSDWTPTAGGTTYGVRWLLGAIVPGTPVPALEFTARVPISAVNGTQYPNTAVASSPDDPSALALRSAQAVVQVVGGATVLASKSTPSPYRPLAGPLVWDLTMLNATAGDVTRLDAIDVLPFDGDGRVPASDFSGGFSALSTANLPTGVFAYVTSATPATLDAQDGVIDGYSDPGSPGNGGYVTPGTGIWACTVDQLGTAGCPAVTEVTAVRFASAEGATAVILGPNQTATWQLSLTPSGDAPGDTYTNRFRARVNPEALALPISSPDVAIQVQVPLVEVTKQTCTAVDPQSCVPGDDSVWGATSTVEPGQAGVFRLRVTNTGALPGTVVVTDGIPAGLVLVPGSAVASAGDVSAFPIWDVGSMLPGASETLTFQAVIPQLGTQTNTVDATITDEFGQTASDSADSQLVAAAVPDVVVTKTSDPPTGSIVSAGDVITYTLEYRNDGLAPGVVDSSDDLTDVLDDATLTGGAVISSPDVSVALTNGVLRVTGPIDAGETVTVSYEVTVKPDGERGNGIIGNVVVPDGGTGECATPAACETDQRIGDLVATKSVDPASGTTVAPGRALTYTLTFQNVGAAPVPVNYVDDLAAVLDDATVTTAPVASDPAALQVSALTGDQYTITGTVAAGQTVTVRYTVTVSPDGQRGDDVISNVLLQPGDVCAADDTSCRTVNYVSVVTATKSSDPVSGTRVSGGQKVTYTLTFTNTSTNPDAAPATVAWTDHLANVLDDATLASGPSASLPVLTPTVAGDRIVVTGSLASGQSATVTYTVTVKPYDEQGNHELGNAISPTGTDPVCVPGNQLCTQHSTIKPPAGIAGIAGLAGTGSDVTATGGATLLLLLGGALAWTGRLRRRPRTA